MRQRDAVEMRRIGVVTPFGIRVAFWNERAKGLETRSRGDRVPLCDVGFRGSGPGFHWKWRVTLNGARSILKGRTEPGTASTQYAVHGTQHSVLSTPYRVPSTE